MFEHRPALKISLLIILEILLGRFIHVSLESVVLYSLIAILSLFVSILLKPWSSAFIVLLHTLFILFSIISIGVVKFLMDTLSVSSSQLVNYLGHPHDADGESLKPVEWQ